MLRLAGPPWRRDCRPRLWSLKCNRHERGGTVDKRASSGYLSTRAGRRHGSMRRRGNVQALVAGLVALGTAVSFTLISTAGVSSAATGQVKLAKSGPASEGPYPWKYPATGTTGVGTGTTV